MKTYQNDHLAVAVDCPVHLLRQTWTGLPTSENYREGFRVSLELAERHRVKRWLIDQRQLRLFNPRDLQWLTQQWMPEAFSRLPSRIKIAIVLTDMNQFGKLGSDLILRASFRLNQEIASRYFVTDTEAREWLLSTS